MCSVLLSTITEQMIVEVFIPIYKNFDDLRSALFWAIT